MVWEHDKMRRWIKRKRKKKEKKQIINSDNKPEFRREKTYKKYGKKSLANLTSSYAYKYTILNWKTWRLPSRVHIIITSCQHGNIRRLSLWALDTNQNSNLVDLHKPDLDHFIKRIVIPYAVVWLIMNPILPFFFFFFFPSTFMRSRTIPSNCLAWFLAYAWSAYPFQYLN